MSAGRYPDDDEDDESESGGEGEAEAEAEAELKDGDEYQSIHEIEIDIGFEPVPIAEFQYEPYSIEENGPPVCPLCGQQLTMVRIDDPERAVVSPCGCRLPPDPFFDPRHT